MSDILGSVNWAGVIVGALFLWAMRFVLRRFLDRSGSPAGFTHSADRGRAVVGEGTAFLLCLIVATAMAVIQNVFAGRASATGIGFLASLVPAAVLIGMGGESPRKHGTARAAAVIVGATVSSTIIHAFNR